MIAVYYEEEFSLYAGNKWSYEVIITSWNQISTEETQAGSAARWVLLSIISRLRSILPLT